MRRVNNGRWMLTMLLMISLVVPGVVAAQQQSVTSPAQVTAPGADVGGDVEPADELFVDTDPSVGTCFNRLCSTHAQCKAWCDEPSAYCAPVDFPPHYKRCHLP